MTRRRQCFIFLLVCVLLTNHVCQAQSRGPDEIRRAKTSEKAGSPATEHLSEPISDAESLDEEEAASRVAVQRFLTILRRQPKPGTALDRVYSFHLVAGTLEEFIGTLRDEAAGADQSGSSTMLLGLFEMKRGNTELAADAFHRAESLRETDPVPGWMLGRTLMLSGQADAAVEAYERAVGKSSDKNELLPMLQELARAARRSKSPETADAVLKRMELLFPDDVRVLEQVASMMRDEGDLEGALRQYQSLAELCQSRNPDQAAQFAMMAARVRIQLGRTEEALRDLETLCETLSPDSWLFREARITIEDLFERTADHAALTAYYESWLKAHPDDLDTMARLAQTLEAQGQNETAREWYGRAVERAPRDPALRRALIDRLVLDKLFSQAATEYERLHALHPESVDSLVDWGRFQLKRSDLAKAERERLAENVWNMLLVKRPDDPVTTIQVAELLRNAGLVDAALSLYRRAIEQAPADPQYREYLGEFLYSRNRVDEALTVWLQIAEGERRTALNLTRLAELLNRYDLKDQALETMAAGCQMAPDFHRHLQYARMLRENATDSSPARAIESLTWIDAAEKLAETLDERRLILEERLASLKRSGLLEQKTAELNRQLIESESSSAEQWLTLARYAQACDQLTLATDAVQHALKIEPDCLPALQVGADLFERAGQIPAATEILRRLASLDVRVRSESLKRLAALERQIGRYQEAREIAQQLMDASPDQPEPIQMFAESCFDLGETEEGLNALRRLARRNSTDVQTLISLADALASQGLTDEAIAVYWQALDNGNDQAAHMRITASLAELHLRSQQFDRLVRDLEARMNDRSQHRNAVFCLSAAFRVAGDLASARATLDRLFVANQSDTELLMQLTQLAEDDGHLQAAADYQRRLNLLAPSESGRERLASLLFRLGEVTEAEAIWIRIGEAAASTDDVVAAIDLLIAAEHHVAARSCCDQLLQREPDNWEAILRTGFLDWNVNDRASALQRFDTLLKLPAPPSSREKAGIVAYSASASSALQWLGGQGEATPLGPVSAQERASTRHSGTVLPKTFGDARGLCLAAKWIDAGQRDRQLELIRELENAPRSPNAVSPAMWPHDLAFVYELARLTPGIRIDHERILALAGQLSGSDDPDSHGNHLRLFRWLFVPQTSSKDKSNLRQIATISKQQAHEAVVCFQSLLKRSPERLTIRPDGLHSPETSDQAVSDISLVVRICDVANQSGEIDRLIAALSRPEASRPELLAGLTLSLSRRSESMDDLLLRLDRLTRLDHRESGTSQSKHALFQDVLAVMKAIMEPAAHSDSQSDPQPHGFAQADSLQKLMSWWLDHRGLYHLNDSMFTLKQVNEDALAFAHHVVDDVDLKDAWLSRRPESVSDVEMLGVDHLLSAEEIRWAEAMIELCRLQFHSDTFADWPGGTSSESADHRLARCVLRAAIAFSDQNLDGTLHELSAAAELAPHDVRLRMSLIELSELNGNLNLTRKFLAELPDEISAVATFRELKRLQIAVREHNREAAYSAANRLSELPLDPGALDYLLKHCRQFKFDDIIERLNPGMARVDTPTQSASNVETMNHLVQQGHLDAAIPIARQLIRRSGDDGTPWRRRTRLSPQQIRERAYDVLKQTGELDRMIVRQQTQLSKSPHSRILAQTLLEYLHAAGRQDEATRLQQTMLANFNGDSRESQWQRVQQQLAADLGADACGTLLEIFARYPDFFLAHFDQSLEILKAEQRIPDLVDAIVRRSAAERRSVLSESQRTVLMRLLTHDERLLESAAEWLSVLCEISPADALRTMHSIENRDAWKNAHMFAVLSRAYLPAVQGSTAHDSATQTAPTQTAATQTAERGGNGKTQVRPAVFGSELCWRSDYETHDSAGHSVDGFGLDRLRLALSIEERRRDLLDSIQVIENQSTECHETIVLRLMIALQENDAADQVPPLLKQLMKTEHQPLPEAVAVDLADILLITQPTMIPEAMQLLETSFSHSERSRFHLASPAVLRFIALARKTDSRAAAGQTIVRCLSRLESQSEDSSHGRIQVTGQRLTAARVLVELDASVEAIQILNSISVEDIEQHRDAGRVRRYAFQTEAHDLLLNATEIRKAAEARLSQRPK